MSAVICEQDVYDLEVERLLNYDDDYDFELAVEDAWSAGSDGFTNSPLFDYVSKSRKAVILPHCMVCGCLTQIKNSQSCGGSAFAVAETQELTLAIYEDDTIPKSPSRVTRDNLHVFAEWQRRIDKELDREPRLAY